MTILLKYLHLYNEKLAKLQLSDIHFSKISPIFPKFCSLRWLPIFTKKFAAIIRAAPADSNLIIN